MKKNPFLCLKISSIYMIAIDSVPKKSQNYKKCQIWNSDYITGNNT